MSTQDDVNIRIFEKMDALSTMLNEVRIDVVELRTELRLRKECPAPGSCVELKKLVDEHDRVFQQARGGWAVIVAATVSSGALGAAISHWMQKQP